ncbi:MAG: SDR family NAD(P)-dependent oxidoreductase [Pseudomonadota bacterium]
MDEIFTEMRSLPQGYAAIVIGQGAIGTAIADALEADPRSGTVLRLSRRTTPAADVCDAETLDAAAAWAADRIDAAHLVFVATGALTLQGRGPEKALPQLDPAALLTSYRLNAVGPILALNAFRRLLSRQERSLFAALSARVGSIGDNGLGGWYGYRASKAALNQLLRTASIELARSRKQAVIAALHPGTVESALSRPFRPDGAAADGIFTPEESACRLLGVLDGLTPERSGGFFAYDGAPIPW